MKNIKEKIKSLFGGKKIKSRKVTKHKLLYGYMVLSGISMFGYGIACVFYNLPVWATFTPLYLLVVMGLYIIIKKNLKLLWTYISDMERGLLIIKLKEESIWTDKQIQNVANWVYPKKREMRGEEFDSINKKIYEGKGISDKDKKRLNKIKGSPLRLTHDPQDGVQRLVLVDSLIYAHTNILPLSQEVIDRFELTDENMEKFDLQREINKLKHDN